MYIMTLRRLNVTLYWTGLVIAYQRSIANSITIATEILLKVKTKYWELSIWQKTSPAKFPETGKFSSPMTKAGVMTSIAPAKIKTTKKCNRPFPSYLGSLIQSAVTMLEKIKREKQGRRFIIFHAVKCK